MKEEIKVGQVGQQEGLQQESPKPSLWNRLKYYLITDGVPLAAGLVGLVAGPVGFGVGYAMASTAVPYLKEKFCLEAKVKREYGRDAEPEPEKKKINWKKTVAVGVVVGVATAVVAALSGPFAPLVVGLVVAGMSAAISYKNGGAVKKIVSAGLGLVKRGVQALLGKVMGRVPSAPEQVQAQQQEQAQVPTQAQIRVPEPVLAPEPVQTSVLVPEPVQAAASKSIGASVDAVPLKLRGQKPFVQNRSRLGGSRHATRVR